MSLWHPIFIFFFVLYHERWFGKFVYLFIFVFSSFQSFSRRNIIRDLVYLFFSVSYSRPSFFVTILQELNRWPLSKAPARAVNQSRAVLLSALTWKNSWKKRNWSWWDWRRKTGCFHSFFFLIVLAAFLYCCWFALIFISSISINLQKKT